ncbi:MAG: hypothetical protein LC798_20155 [Chloroflexi bacterium]|nr:hypothetical protein [Chloroflexota bacterium]
MMWFRRHPDESHKLHAANAEIARLNERLREAHDIAREYHLERDEWRKQARDGAGQNANLRAMLAAAEGAGR